MSERRGEEKRVAIEFIVECMHCHKTISTTIVYWPETDASKLKGRKSISSAICQGCIAKGKGITK